MKKKTGKSTLNEANVREIRKLAASGIMHREIGKKFGITRSAVSYIVSRKNWAYVV